MDFRKDAINDNIKKEEEREENKYDDDDDNEYDIMNVWKRDKNHSITYHIIYIKWYSILVFHAMKDNFPKQRYMSNGVKIHFFME